YLSDIGCLEIQGASLASSSVVILLRNLFILFAIANP
ncbi:hypothetical protein AB81_2689, partial [Escherichia coli 6-537-08_S1_C3]